MKPSEFRGLSDEELRFKSEESAREIFNLRFRRGTGKIENPAKLRRLRRDLARVKTILRERQLGLQRGR